MSAVTPNAKNHAGLPPMASRFVQVAALPWEKTRFAGVEQKTLVFDRETGVVTSLLRFAPGAKLPDHEHVLTEQTYVLEGSLVCGEGECKAGEFVWRPAGSRHEAWAGPQGGPPTKGPRRPSRAARRLRVSALHGVLLPTGHRCPSPTHPRGKNDESDPKSRRSGPTTASA